MLPENTALLHVGPQRLGATLKTRNHSASKKSHIPSFTSGCFSTEGAKGVTVGQKARAEPFFPTITRSFGNGKGSQKRSQTRDAEEQRSSCPWHPCCPALTPFHLRGERRAGRGVPPRQRLATAACPCQEVTSFIPVTAEGGERHVRCNVKAVP